MKILLTGPSCAGKTTLACQLPVSKVVHLDSYKDGTLIRDTSSEVRLEQVLVYEGIVSGSEFSARGFLDLMNLVLLLEPPLPSRFLWCISRDGAMGTFRWVYNEFCWWFFARSLVLRHPHVLRVSWESHPAFAEEVNSCSGTDPNLGKIRTWPIGRTNFNGTYI